MHAIGASQSFPPRANCCSAATPRLTALQILSIFAVAVTVSTAVIVAVFAVIIFLCKTRPRLPHAGTLLVPPACYRTSARIALIPSRADFCQSFDLNDFSPNRLSSCVWVAVAGRPYGLLQSAGIKRAIYHKERILPANNERRFWRMITQSHLDRKASILRIIILMLCERENRVGSRENTPLPASRSIDSFCA